MDRDEQAKPVVASDTRRSESFDYLIWCIDPSFPGADEMKLEMFVQQTASSLSRHSVLLSPRSLMLDMDDEEEADAFIELVLSIIRSSEEKPLLVLTDTGGHSIYGNIAIAGLIKSSEPDCKTMLLNAWSPMEYQTAWGDHFDYILDRNCTPEVINNVIEGSHPGVYLCRNV